jgi:hypothetical protein
MYEKLVHPARAIARRWTPQRPWREMQCFDVIA